MAAEEKEAFREVSPTDVTVMQAISKAELDQQITTARAFPRSLKRFVTECMDMATLNEQVAADCIYAIPRDSKMIEGPSVRLAEIVASAWGNCRAGARVVDEGPRFITAQAVFHDLERNVCITYEVRRRITNKSGQRYKDDMIGVTGNAACSVALRNAVFKGVPKAFWSDIYEAARKAAVGDIKTIANKRADALAYLQKMGVTRDMVLATLNLAGEEDIGLDQMATLRGIITAIKEGDTTIEQAFATTDSSGRPRTGSVSVELVAKWVKDISDILATDKDEPTIAEMLRGADEELKKFEDLYQVVLDKLAALGVITKANYRKYLKIEAPA